MRHAISTIALLLVTGCRAPSPAAPAPPAPPPAADGAALAPATDEEPDREALAAQARAAHREQRWLACGEAYERLSAGPEAKPGHAYDAACCFAKAEQPERAFAALQAAGALGWRLLGHTQADPDLASLHADARWPEVLAVIEANRVAYQATVDARLLELYEADQADRRPGPDGIDWSVVAVRDRAREAEVLERIEAGAAKVADDWYHAAMIMQHGDGEEPIERAHAWALRAVELDPDHAPARWLAAAAEDRLLMRRGLPQRYGTQYVLRDERWVLYEVDPSVSDEERARWNVPPLAEAQQQAERMNQP